MGLGGPPASVTLGEALNLSLPLKLEPGESLSPGCIRADVMQGDARVPVQMVSAAVETTPGGAPVLRVRTAGPLQEPIVTVSLALGCPPRMIRRFTLLADPPGPGHQPAVATPFALTPVEPSTAAIVAAAGGAVAPARAASAAYGSGAQGAASKGMAGTPAAAAATVTMTPVATTTPMAATAAAAPVDGAGAAPVRVTSDPAAFAERATMPAVDTAPAPPAAVRSPAARPPTATARKGSTRPAATERARLRLDPVAPPPQLVQALVRAEAAEQAASAAAAAAAAAETRMQAQMKELEASVARWRKDSEADRQALADLRARLAESESRAAWVPWLAALAAGLGLLGVGLAWRNRSAARPTAWWQNDAAAEPSGLPQVVAAPEHAEPLRVADEPAVMASAAGPPDPPAALSPPVRIEVPDQVSGSMSLSMPMPLVASATASRPSISSTPSDWGDVTVEEQIDLEQQADFFVVLGQEDAAIDLLMSHLRRSGGTAPMPYLKLLELHHRRGEQGAYERTRSRFNQRFNAVAPAWEEAGRAQRSLDDYPVAVQRVQRVWPQPLDAMAELESTLFRRGAGAELFDLPAYHDVMMLYQVARDLRRHEPVPAGTDSVDVLLPLGDEPDSVFDALQTSPVRAVRAGTPDTGTVDLDLDLPPVKDDASRPDAAVDLDLDEPLPFTLDRPTRPAEDLGRADSDFAALGGPTGRH